MVIYTLPPARISAEKVNAALESLDLTALPDQSQATMTGRASGAGTGAPGELSVTQAQTILRDGWASMSFGTGTKATGARLNFEQTAEIMYALDSGNVSRVILAWNGTTNQLEVGSSAGGYGNILLRSNRWDFRVGNTVYWTGFSSSVLSGVNVIGWDDALTAPVLRHNNRSSGAAADMVVRAQGTTAASAAAGRLRLQAGRHGSGGSQGAVVLEGNSGDDSTFHEGVRVRSSGTAAQLSFYGGTPVSKPTVSGSRGGNAALASLITALADIGLITDSTSA